MSVREGIQVFIRIRPHIGVDEARDSVVRSIGDDVVTVTGGKHDTSCKFDHVFDQDAGQQHIFEKMEPLLYNVLRGYNGCILAYGQTSAGKTHTMLGPNGGQELFESQSEWGVLPRAADYLFKDLQSRERSGLLGYSVKASFVQIYNETLYDLLATSSGSDGGGIPIHQLKIREVHPTVSKKSLSSTKTHSSRTSPNNEVYVSGLSEFRVHSSKDVIALMVVGSANRSTRATQFNESSSRSHAILQLYFEMEVLQVENDQNSKSFLRSKLNFVDLAGCEKMAQSYTGRVQGGSSFGDGGSAGTNGQGVYLKELTTINKSLSTLGIWRSLPT